MRLAAAAVRIMVSWLDRMAVVALLAMMMLTTSDVLLRKLINKPILGVTELVEFALGVTFFFALPGVFARGGNIAVDMIDQWLPKWGRALTTLAALLCVLTLALLSWHMWKPMMDAISFGDTSSDLQILKIWFLAPAWAGVVLGLLVSIFVLFNGRFLPSDQELSQGPL
jgi:TRAP-type C4-dicarboxylate transport system permease small subunit